jgi:hypothetical protein
MNWKIAFALSAVVAALGPLAGGCSTDACTQADDQIAACSTQSVSAPSESLACTAKRICQADCINKATCAEINEALCIGQSACRPLSGNSAFATCMNSCDGQ